MKRKETLIGIKKLQSRIRKLSILCLDGDKNESTGANDVLEKVYYALKDKPKTKLDNVKLNMFGEYGYIKADNFFIGRVADSFFLFKAKEVQTLSDASKKGLERKVKEKTKELSSERERSEFLKNIPFVEYKQLSKSDIAEAMYQEGRKNSVIYEEVLEYLGKEKLTKKDYTSLTYGDIQYIVHLKEEKFKNTKILNIVDNYKLTESKSEIRLSRKSDVREINSEELIPYTENIDELENKILKTLQDLKKTMDEPKGESKGKKVTQFTVDLVSYRGKLKKIDKELENIIEPQELSKIYQNVQEDDEVSFINKDILSANLDTKGEYKKIGLKKVNELEHYFKNEGKEIGKTMGVVLENGVEVINYGVFKDANLDNALENLILYAKSLNEMVENGQKNNNDIQIHNGGIGI